MFDRETKREKSLEQIKKQGGGAKKDLIMADLDGHMSYVPSWLEDGPYYILNEWNYNP